MNTKEKFFERELTDLGFSDDQKKTLRSRMLDGLEIMSKKEITETLEQYKNWGLI
jgi:glutaredoxin-related protein